MGLRKIGPELQGGVIGRNSVIEAALCLEHVAETHLGISEVRLKGEGLLQACRRLGKPPLILERHPQVVKRTGMVWLELQGPPIAGHGLVKSTLAPEGNPQVERSLGIIGHQTHGVLVAGGRRGELSLRQQDIPQVEVCFGDVRLEAEDRVVIIDRQIVPTGLAGDHAEKLPGTDLVRIDLHDLKAEALGLAKLARVILFPGRSQCGQDRDLRGDTPFHGSRPAR